jgi:hypothetical protein
VAEAIQKGADPCGGGVLEVSASGEAQTLGWLARDVRDELKVLVQVEQDVAGEVVGVRVGGAGAGVVSVAAEVVDEDVQVGVVGGGQPADMGDQ